MDFAAVKQAIDFAMANAGPFANLVGAVSATIGLSMTVKNQKKIKELEVKIDNNDKVRKKVNRAGLRTLINDLAEACLGKGYCTEEDLETIEPLFECYKDEGGNSYICNKMKRVRALPVKDLYREENK